LGGLLIFAEELQIQRSIHHGESIEICFVGDRPSMFGPHHTGKGEPVEIVRAAESRYPGLLGAMENIEGIESCYLSETAEVLLEHLRMKPLKYQFWPAVGEDGLNDYKCGSTVYAQGFFQENGHIPYLRCRTELAARAQKFLEQHVLPSMPVVVHLKNNPLETGCSNANFEAWSDFFGVCESRYDVKFVLIGNEEVPSGISGLSNVILSKDFGSDLSNDLALIQAGPVFMGMSSGPCVMKVFSDAPYVVYKNPDHHKEEMEAELGNGVRFSFATPFQKFLRVFETGPDLLSEFSYIYENLRKNR
jgi:hypothetical protein